MSCTVKAEAVLGRNNAPSLAKSQRSPTRTGTAESQASKMLPKLRTATASHASKACNALVVFARKHLPHRSMQDLVHEAHACLEGFICS